MQKESKEESLREKLHQIIFEAETKKGRIFDLGLLWLIVFSVVIVILESIDSLNQQWNGLFLQLEWIFTIVFSIEYVLRIYCVHRPWKYIFSFYGLIDFFSIVPTYLSLFIDGGASLLVIRGFRLLRVFRLFKLGRYVGEASVLIDAIKASRFKITVFLLAVMSLAVTMGAIMYLVEGRENGFTSIPRSTYWAVVTMTTVGYGDIAPQTVLGQSLASLLMIMGYGIIAVPTGIVSVGIAEAQRKKRMITSNTETCRHCLTEGHAPDAVFCRICGEKL